MQLTSVGEIPLEGVLDAERDALRLLLQSARVDSARAFVEHPADASGQHCAELAVTKSGQRADRVHPRGEQAFLGLRADAG